MIDDEIPRKIPAHLIERERAANGLKWLIEDIKSGIKRRKAVATFRFVDLRTIILTTLLAMAMLWIGIYLIWW